MAYLTEESNISGTIVGRAITNGGVYEKFAQIFTANRDYTLQAIALFLAAFTPPLNTTGGIYSVSGGEPNAKLEDFTATATKGVGSGQEETIVLDSPLELSEGIQYAIVIDQPASDFFYVGYLHEAGSSYPDGVGLWRISSSWSAISNNNDWYFKTLSAFSLTPTPSNEATGTILFPTLSWVVD